MSPRIIDKEKKKREILLAAMKVFSQKGASKSRMADVAAEAKIGKGTIYEYFRDRDQILTEAFYLVMGEMEAKLKSVLDETWNPEDKICAMMQVGYDALSGFSADTLQIFLDIWSEGIRQRDKASGFAKNLKKIYAKIRRQISDVLRQGIKDGHFRDMDTLAVASCLMAIIDGLLLQIILDRKTLDPQAVIEEGLNLIMVGIRRERS